VIGVKLEGLETRVLEIHPRGQRFNTWCLTTGQEDKKRSFDQFPTYAPRLVAHLNAVGHDRDLGTAFRCNVFKLFDHNLELRRVFVVPFKTGCEHVLDDCTRRILCPQRALDGLNRRRNLCVLVRTVNTGVTVEYLVVAVDVPGLLSNTAWSAP
jgi:hypothetical protein